MSGKLIIQGKAWGEFESAKRSKGNIEISGYRSYGGTHTVRMVDQPQLNENQQGMLQEVIKQYDTLKPKTVLHALEHLSMIAFLLDEMEEVTEEDCIVVAQAFLDWAQEQEEE